ncbi:MAG: terminase small subunit [Lachnospiraceae bacterium]|nr:terminase small subunit [Lachnospiraceae bacterium]
MDKLTPKQKAFADNYIISGNATDAAKKAGYKEKAAYAIGAENLRKPQIMEYIQNRTAPAEQKRIATGDEVMQFFTRVMNGEEKDAFGLDASLDTKIKAAVELAKRTCDIKDNKTDVEEKEVVRIELTRNGKPV